MIMVFMFIVIVTTVSYYHNGNDFFGQCKIQCIGNNINYVTSNCYEGTIKPYLIGIDSGSTNINFTTKKLIVLEMSVFLFEYLLRNY